jgi:FtsP/CotA-like multicopper oxidase with cupredoxin domain
MDRLCWLCWGQSGAHGPVIVPLWRQNPAVCRLLLTARGPMTRWIPLGALLLGLADHSTRSAVDAIAPNDNRQSAGKLANGILTIALEARNGSWQPEGDRGRTLEVAAFGEEGKPLSTPGPVIRVSVGTEVQATVRNRLDKPLIVFGFGKTRGVSDSVIVPVGEASPLSFRATTPGTYYYVAKRGTGLFGGRPDEDTQLHGVIVVEAPNAPRHATDDILAVSWGVRSTSRAGPAWPAAR